MKSVRIGRVGGGRVGENGREPIGSEGTVPHGEAGLIMGLLSIAVASVEPGAAGDPFQPFALRRRPLDDRRDEGTGETT